MNELDDGFRLLDRGTCRASRCRAPIRWVITEASGDERKKMPLDGQPHEDGNVVLVGDRGAPLARVLGPLDLLELGDHVPRYKSHHAVCPARKQFKGPRR